MKQLLLACLLLACAWHSSARPEEKLPLQDEISVTFWLPKDAHVCGTSLIGVTFTNNTTKPVLIPNITISLDDSQNEYITFKDIGNSPGFMVMTGWGTSSPVFRYPGLLQPGSSAILNMEVQYSCAFFDIEPLTGFRVRATGQAQTKLAPYIYYPFDETSDTYDLRWTKITPQLNLPAVFTQYEAPFSIIVPLEITGNYCDNDFTVTIDGFPPCFDTTGVTYSIIIDDVVYGYLPLGPTQYSDGFIFEIKSKELGIPRFCEDNYWGGMGEAKLLISNLKFACDCGVQDAYNSIEFGFTPCGNDESPDDCKEDGNVVPQITTIQEVFIEKPDAGKLTITNISAPNAPFSLCSASNTLAVEIVNTGFLPSYFVDLDFSNQLGYDISGAKINGIPYNGLFQIGPAVHLDFGANQNQQYGFSDINGDGIYEELYPGDTIVVLISFFAGDPYYCALGDDDPCDANCQETTFSASAVQASVNWSNACQTTEHTASYSHDIEVQPFYDILTTDGAVINKNYQQTVKLSLTGGVLDGFSGYLDQGDVNQFICITSNLPADAVAYGNVVINGISVPVQFDQNGYADLGFIDPTQWNPMDIQFDLTLKYCPASPSELILKITHGVYFDNCPNCYITLTCNNANFLLPCSGGGANDPAACELFAGMFGAVYNKVYEGYPGPLPSPIKVYPCDDLVLEVNALVVNNLPGFPMLLGITVSNEFVDYFQGLSDYDLTVTAGNGATYTVNLSGMSVAPVPNEPYSVLYFSAASAIDLLTFDHTISGTIQLRMADAFDAKYDKIDYFAPLMGFQDGDTLRFCSNGFMDLYALDVCYRVEEEVSVSCSTGGVYTAKLIKEGGEIHGPDFPGIPRIAAIFDGSIAISLPAGFEGFDPDSCAQKGSSFSILAGDAPSGYESHNQELQSCTVSFETNCAGTTPITVIRTVLHRPASDCEETKTDTTTTSGAGGNLPNIESHFDLSILPSEIMINNTYTLSTFATNLGGDATEAWIQLEYNPQHISIDLASVLGDYLGSPSFVNNNNPANPRQALIIPIGALGNDSTDLTQTIILNFLEASCNGTLVQLYGFHRCRCTPLAEYRLAADYDESVCLDSESLLQLGFVDSELSMDVDVCGVPSSYCHNFSLSINLDNAGLGNTEDVTLLVDIPNNLNLISAEYVEDGSGDCAQEGVPVDVTGILGGGWTIPDNFLPGILSGVADAERKGHLQLYFAGCGDLNDTDVSVRCFGLTPCGDTLERLAVFPELVRPFELNTDIILEDSIRYNCTSKTGTITLTVTTEPDWPINGAGTIALYSPDVTFNLPAGNIIPFGQVPFTVGPITFTNNNPDKCAFEITVQVRVCGDVVCVPGMDPCEGICKQENFTIQYPGVATPGSLVFAPNFCSSTTSVVTATIGIYTTPMYNTYEYTHANFYCDLNNNGIVDPTDLLLQSVPRAFTEFLKRIPNTNMWSVNITVNTASLINNCNGGNIIVEFENLAVETICACGTPAIGYLCCNCSDGGEGDGHPHPGGSGTGGRTDTQSDVVDPRAGLASTVFPNPSSGIFALRIESAQVDVANIAVFNQLGVEVYRSVMPLDANTQGAMSIDLTQLPAGLYSLHISTSNGSRQHLLSKN